MVKQHCVDHTLFFSWEATPLPHNLTKPTFFSVGSIEQQQQKKQTNKQAAHIPFVS